MKTLLTFLPDEPEPDYTQVPEIQGWTRTQDKTPSDETEVLILVNGVRRIGWILWETPSYEEAFKAFPYWDDPHNDGQDWEWRDVTHWAPLLSDSPEGSMKKGLPKNVTIPNKVLNRTPVCSAPEESQGR